MPTILTLSLTSLCEARAQHRPLTEAVLLQTATPTLEI